MPIATEKRQRQSKKFREFLAKKQEEESARHAALQSIIQNPTKDNKENVQAALKCIYIDKCQRFLSSGDTKEIFKAINILKKLLTDGHDIDDIIKHLLCHDSLLFFQFVKQVRRDLLNHFEAYDEIVHACKPSEIIELLRFGVIELEHATKINNKQSLGETIYMFMQLAFYDELILEYLWQTYPSIINKQGLLSHMVFYNINHEIIVYLDGLGINNLDENLTSLRMILSSYKDMEEKYKGSRILKSRLLNVIRMIVDMVFNQGYELPSMTEFINVFNQTYAKKYHTNLPEFMQSLPWEIHWYIGMQIYNLKVQKAFPYDTPDGKWA